MSVWVGRYAMVGGEVREHGPWLVDRLRTRDDEQVRVLVLAEPVDDRSGEFCAEVAEAVAALFGRESLSLTGGLQRALEQAHANLSEWNRRSLREHRVAVGITCVAVRDGTATIAQVGPGVVYDYSPQGLRRIATEGTASARPLGGPEPIEPQFTAVTLEDRELLLLTSTVERDVPPTAVGNALAAGPERALPELFLRTRRIPDMTAVLIADLDYDEQPAPAPLIAADEPEGRRVAIATDAERAKPERGLRGTPATRRETPMPTVRRAPRTVGRGGGRDARVPWRLVGYAAVAVIALAVLAWAVLPGLLREDRAAQLDAAINAGNGYLAAANASADVAQRRAALAAALAEAEQARAIDPQDPRVGQLEAQARAALAVLDAVFDVPDLRPVITFSGRITAPLRPVALTAGGGSLWMIDGERGRVFRIDPTDSTDPVEVYRTGANYDGTPARDPIAITWEQASRRLLVFDVGHSLFAIGTDGAAARPITLRGAAELGDPVAITSYVGNLYLLDPAAGEVWRYLPAGDGFDSERAGLLGGADLTQASGLAVDGELYVLDATGQLRRFRSGKEVQPLLQGIDEPPDSPVGLVEDTARGLLYVADRSGQRIVVSDRNGPFVRQYRNPAFFDLTAIALGSDGATVYVLTGDGISAFDPPP